MPALQTIKDNRKRYDMYIFQGIDFKQLEVKVPTSLLFLHFVTRGKED